jgi:hypothetical protein
MCVSAPEMCCLGHNVVSLWGRTYSGRHCPGKGPLPPCEQRLTVAAQGLRGVPTGFMCVVRWVDNVVIKILESKNEEKHLVSLKERNQLKRNIPKMSGDHF